MPGTLFGKVLRNDPGSKPSIEKKLHSMFATALACTIFLTASLFVQLLWAWRFVALYRRRPAKPIADEQLPRAAVILSLRGADPSLAGCLRGLLAQNYPHYDVK